MKENKCLEKILFQDILTLLLSLLNKSIVFLLKCSLFTPKITIALILHYVIKVVDDLNKYDIRS